MGISFMARQQSQLNRSTSHELTPVASCRDRGRQSFIFHAKRHLGQFARLSLSRQFEYPANPLPSEDPQDTDTGVIGTHVRTGHAQPEQSSAFAAWSALNIGSQQQMWRALNDMLVHQAPVLAQRAETLAARAASGSLELSPDLEMPAYFLQTAYHGQPGGYCLDRGGDDWHAGALQEAGGNLYSRGAGTGARDSKGQAVVRFLGETFPEFAPDKVIDLGCGYGGQTSNYAAGFPDAEIHGVDLGASLLRYAHLRAKSLGLKIHFRQACASDTRFPNASFDLVVSNILLHEIPQTMLEGVMQESFRLLKPGGLVVHQDVPTQRPGTPEFQQWLSNWQVAHNDEPFWKSFSETSVPKALVNAGFSQADIFERYQPQIDGPLLWYMVGARKQ
jgi:ubiquinone/menaquinone biosynthesis C-methylase UbiE